MQKRRLMGALGVAAMGAAVALGGLPAGAQANEIQVNRFAGADRYATSAAAALGMLDGFSRAVFAGNSIIVASGSSFADALAAAPLAGSRGAAILLVPSTGPVPQSVLDAITALFTTADRPDVQLQLTVVGGEAAVSDAVFQQLDAHIVGLGLQATTSLDRIAGPNRYETAELVVEEIPEEDVGTFDVNVASGLPPDLRRTAFLVNGSSFSDALVAGPPGYDDGKGGRLPIVLAETGSIPQATLDTLAQQRIGLVFVVGGQAAVSDAALAALPNGIEVIRIDGADRFATAANMAGLLLLNADEGGFGWAGDEVGMANLLPAGGGADALAAAPYLGLASAPLLGMGGPQPPAPTIEVANNLGLGNRLAAIDVFGGENAVPQAAVDAFLAALT